MLLTVVVLAGAAPALGQTNVAADSPVAAWMQQATQHMALDEWAQAAAVWSKVIVEDSTHVVAHLNRAMSRYRAGDCEGRDADARQALRLLNGGAVPADLERLVYRAQAHGHLLEFEQAVRLLEDAESRYPDSRPVSVTLLQMRRRASGEFDWTCGSNQP
jgi:tetratricopeptide (TPR) repeat protein